MAGWGSCEGRRRDLTRARTTERARRLGCEVHRLDKERQKETPATESELSGVMEGVYLMLNRRGLRGR